MVKHYRSAGKQKEGNAAKFITRTQSLRQLQISLPLFRIPPPHLSPFVDYDEGAYVPEYAKTLKNLQAAARKEVLPLPDARKDREDPQDLLAKEKQKMINAEQQFHEELKKEQKGERYTSAGSTVEKETSTTIIQTGESTNIDDDAEMSKLLLPCKKRNLIDSIQISKKRKQAKYDTIIQRKKKLDEAENQRS